MSEEELELRITMDDPGEDDLEEDTFHDRKTEKPLSRLPQGGDTSSE
jgi:hypothetical protein